MYSFGFESLHSFEQVPVCPLLVVFILDLGLEHEIGYVTQRVSQEPKCEFLLNVKPRFGLGSAQVPLRGPTRESKH